MYNRVKDGFIHKILFILLLQAMMTTMMCLATEPILFVVAFYLFLLFCIVLSNHQPHE